MSPLRKIENFDVVQNDSDLAAVPPQVNLPPGSQNAYTGIDSTGKLWVNGVAVTGTGSGTVAALAAPQSGVAAPSPLSSENQAPAGTQVVMWVQDNNGNYAPAAYVDPYSNDTVATGPPGPGGTLTFCRRTWFSDGAVVGAPGRNSFVNVYHRSGVGTDPLNQERALHAEIQNNPDGSDTSNHHAMQAVHGEAQIFGTPVWVNPGAPDSEVCAGSFQTADFHTDNTTTHPSLGVTAIRAQVFREAGAGNYNAPTWSCVLAKFQNLSAVAGNGQPASAIIAQMLDQAGPGTNIPAQVVWIKAPGASRFASNYGLYVEDFGANAADYSVYVVGGRSHFGGAVDGVSYRLGTAGPIWQSGIGSPETVVTAPVGSLYSRTDGGANTTLYVKESGVGNTGWIAK